VIRAIYDYCKALDLPLVGIHGLRHSFASYMYALGVSAKIAMEIGGWSDDRTMVKIYTHVSQTMRLTANNAMIAYFADLA
jgi:Site-specific recombinase XerD